MAAFFLFLFCCVLFYLGFWFGMARGFQLSTIVHSKTLLRVYPIYGPDLVIEYGRALQLELSLDPHHPGIKPFRAVEEFLNQTNTERKNDNGQET